MSKKILFIIGGGVLAVLLIVGGIFAYRSWDNNRSNTNAEYTKCMEEANALQEKNNKILEEVDADIEQCTRDYIVAQGYEDDVNCIQNYDDPVCQEEKRDENDRNIGRYNIEVFGGNLCIGYDEDGYEIIDESKTPDARAKAKGYEVGISVTDCAKYLEEDESSDSIVEKVIDEVVEDKVYVCEDYFGSRYEVVYNDTDLVSVSNDENSVDIEKERKLLSDEYNGDVEAYISVVKSFCSD